MLKCNKITNTVTNLQPVYLRTSTLLRVASSTINCTTVHGSIQITAKVT